MRDVGGDDRLSVLVVLEVPAFCQKLTLLGCAHRRSRGRLFTSVLQGGGEGGLIRNLGHHKDNAYHVDEFVLGITYPSVGGTRLGRSKGRLVKRLVVRRHVVVVRHGG